LRDVGVTEEERGEGVDGEQTLQCGIGVAGAPWVFEAYPSFVPDFLPFVPSFSNPKYLH
jgi:hypothetical protein